LQVFLCARGNIFYECGLTYVLMYGILIYIKNLIHFLKIPIPREHFYISDVTMQNRGLPTLRRHFYISDVTMQSIGFPHFVGAFLTMRERFLTKDSIHILVVYRTILSILIVANVIFFDRM
jgi:hypothetical protein